MQLFLSYLESPLGEMLLVTDAQQNMRALDFADHKAHVHRGLREHYGSAELSERLLEHEKAIPCRSTVTQTATFPGF